MAGKRKKKKLLVTAAVLVATAAVGAGVWFATRGSGEPVNVYPFQYIGMTEFWGDAQESYGPVTTDKIQTEFLSDTQTVTEVAVKDGDTVKKGDVLFSFDTTLDALSLERKRLEVEKIKVQIKAAEERLGFIKKLEPYTPSGELETEKEDLGKELKEDLYSISDRIGQDKKVYNGKSKETALICWLKEGTPVTDTILQTLYDTAIDYQKENAEKDEEVKVPEETEAAEGSSASALPDIDNPLNLLLDGQQTTEPTNPPKPPKITLYPFYDKTALKPYDIELKQVYEEEQLVNKYIVPDVYKFTDGVEKTCWLLSAIRISDGAVLTELKIDECPVDGKERENWETLWGEGIKLQYTRKVTWEGKIVKEKQVVPFDQSKPVQLKLGHDAVLVISSQIHDLPKETELTYSISPADGIFEITQDGDDFYLMGKPETLTVSPVEYTVSADYKFFDNEEDEWNVIEPFTFSVSVESQAKNGEFYVVFKSTKDNYLKGFPLVWQGAKVTAYEGGTFDAVLYDASGFLDHTLPPPEDIEIELPEINPNEMYTEEQLLEMQKQLHTTIKEQKEKLQLAESEYNIMQRELGDGNVYAEIDGKVVSLLTEEEARAEKQPMIKVSGGGGFYIEGSVSELEKEKLKLGQEVTVNDWNTGGMYTGEVVSIGDFPSDSDNWNGMGNPTASYYPFKAFVTEDADLRAGSYVSMSYSTASAQQGIYLEKAFVRTEKEGSYIFVRGADGKLEKRMVQVGKVLWGSYYEILSELSEEDCLAFPYGKHVKHGAPTVESDISALYTY